MKRLCTVLALLLVAAPAFAANLAVNGTFDNGETGWTQWAASWSAGHSWAVVTTDGYPIPSARARLNAGAASFGWFQKVQGAAASSYTISADWFGNFANTNSGCWAEVMFFRVNPTTITDADIITRINTGAATDIAFKKDAWGQNLAASAYTWAWESAGLSKATGGNNGVVNTNNSATMLVVALKFGHSQDFGPITGNVRWDNIAVNGPAPVPEPSSILAIFTGLTGIAGIVLRRR